MSYIDESLSAGETVVARFRLHWTARLWLVLWLVLGIPTLGLLWLAALYEFFRLRSIEQGVTNKRVIYKTGIVSRHSEEMKLSSIETVEIRQGVLGRLLGYGNVELTGRGTSSLVFRRVDDPIEVKRQIESVSHRAV